MNTTPTTMLGTAAEEALRSALSAPARPPRPSALAATRAFAWRAMLSFKHAPEQLLDVFFMPFVSLLMFSYLFGGAIAGSTGDYLQYFVPGVLVQTVVLLTVYTGTALSTDIAKGVFDRFRSMPFWQPAGILGALCGDLVRYTIAVTMTVAASLLLGFRPEGGPVGVVLSLLLLLAFASSVGWIFAALGVVLRKPESISGTSMMVLYPLTFVSNIFVSSESMTPWMRAVVEVNPVSHAATAVRGLMHGTATAGQVGLVLMACGVLTAVFAPLTMYLYRNKK